MSRKKGHSKKLSRYGTFAVCLVIGLELMVLIALLFNGKNFAQLSPKGFIAEEQLSLMVFTIILLLVVALPTLFILYFTAWKYRESNTKAVHDPNARHSKFLDVSMWLIPSVFMFVLAIVMLPATQKLDPSKPIASEKKALTIQVVAMQWKWVFIYPEQNIATVNYVQIPTDTPIIFELTADESPMSSFWIPNLGGQLYAMTGHVKRLNLMAETPGDYPGSSAELTGAGFAGMKFIARADSKENFDLWVQNVRRAPDALSDKEYSKLLTPSENNIAAFYSKTDPDLFNNLLIKYTGAANNEPAEHGSGKH